MRQAAALGALVLYVGRSVTGDQLVDALWPGAPPPTARRTLQSHLSRLRSALGEGMITRDAMGYRLSDAATIDVLEFERLVGLATSTPDPRVAVTHLETARALWRGEPYPELIDWLPATAERVRLVHLHEALDEDLLELKLDIGDPAALVAEASALVARQPVRERRWGLLMRALYRSGRQADALQAFQDARGQLIAAVGVEPGPELQALERAVLEHDPVLDAPGRRWSRGSLVPAALTPAPDGNRVVRFFDAMRQRDPLVGRDGELARCLDHWGEARGAGRPAVVVLRGEPGIGKTRLAAEIVARAVSERAGVYVARGRERHALPYAPLAEAFADRSPELTRALEELAAGPTSPQQVAMAQQRVAAAFGRALQPAGSADPTVLVVDDAQWADLPTIEALQRVIGHELSGPVLVVVTLRSTEVPAAAPDGIGRLLEELPRMVDCLDLVLTGVDRNAAGRIADHRAQVVLDQSDKDWLFAQSGGSPLYLIELARQDPGTLRSRAEPPRSISEIVRRRVTPLPDAARDVVLAGAVLGEEFDIRVAAAMVSQPVDEAVDHAGEAVDGQLLYRQSDLVFRFSHGVTRRAVEAISSTSRLLSLHWAAGVALEGSPMARIEEVADHLLAGAPVGDPVRATRAVLAATSSARDQLDPSSAMRLLARAGAALRGVGAAEQRVLAEVLLASAALTARQGMVGEAKASAAKAAELARALGDPVLVARAAVGYAELVNAGEPDDLASALCYEALDMLGPADGEWTTRVASALANYHSVVLADVVAARPFADRAVAAAGPDLDSRAEALWAQACALLGSADIAERARVAEALRACTRPGSRRHAEAVRLAAHTKLEAGDRVGYEREVAALERLSADHGSWDASIWAQIGRGQLALMDGRLADWLDVSATLDDLSGGSVYAWSLKTIQESFRLYERRELDRLVPLLESMAGVVGLSGVHALLVQALLQAGKADRAAAELDRIGRDGFVLLRPEQTYTGALAMLLEAAVDLGRPADVRALADRLEPYSGVLVVSTQGAFSLGAVDRYLAVAAIAGGDYDEAGRLLAAAAALEARVGATLGARYTTLAEQWLRSLRGDPPDEQVLAALGAAADRLGLYRFRSAIDAVDGGPTLLAG